MSIAVFLPTRKGSQRVLNKNTRPFSSHEGGLLELKLLQLSELDVEEIILSTNDENSLAIAKRLSRNYKNLRIYHRPQHLASNLTNLTDLINYVPTITKCEHILWTHVTSPMVNGSIYSSSIQEYKKSLQMDFDSLMSVNSFKNFLWDKSKNDIINRTGKTRWPQTQDLKDLYEVNSAIFIAPRFIYEKESDRIGKKPFLFELNKIEGLDVDWEEDFKIAEAVYEKFKKH